MTIAEFPTLTIGSIAGAPQRHTIDGAARATLAGAAVSVPPIVLLHLAASGAMDPAGWTISDYVVGVPGGMALFALTAAALAAGAGALVRGLAAMPGAGAVRSVLGLWAAGLLVAAVFPTNVRGTPGNLSSEIHLYAGAVVFAALPIATWMLARRLGRTAGGGRWARVLGAATLVSGLLSTALILNRLPGVIGMPELMLPPGILQRVAGAAEIALLAIAAVAVLRTRGADRP